MLDYILKNKLQLIGIHILIGFLATLPIFPKLFGPGIIVAFLIVLISSKNKNEEALLFSSYIMAVEVFLRMCKGFIVYETGKYTVVLFLMLGMFLGKVKNKISMPFIIYLFLLLLGIVFTKVPEGESIRRAVVFNLSGPVSLGICAIYFYKRRITKQQLFDALFFCVLPLFSMVTFMYFRTPDLKEIVFTGAANYATSGGFGPNQVATSVGLGIFIIGLFLVSKKSLTGYIWLDSLFFVYFIYRGLLTFSRGGMITGIIALVAFAFFYFLSQKNSLKLSLKYILLGAGMSIGVWLYTSNITGGMLDNRYTGRNATGAKKRDATSGRIKILQNQFLTFTETPLGIGVGNGKYKRQLATEHVTAASHNEIGRLLEEHGILGFIMLLILFITALSNIIFLRNFQKSFTVAFFLLWFLTVNHSAMRVVFPSFIYGLCLINIIPTKNEG